MYLSRLIFDTSNISTRKLLANHYELHRFIWSAFPLREEGGAGRVLYRMEEGRQEKPVMLLVQSIFKPDWSKVPRELLAQESEFKEYLPKVKRGQRYRFRLRANPTAKRSINPKLKIEDGHPVRKRVGLLKEEDRLSWLIRKSQQSGFQICEVRIQSTGEQESKRGDSDQTMKHIFAEFEGVLEITDEKIFLDSIESGIGSAKGFGFGLLSISPT